MVVIFRYAHSQPGPLSWTALNRCLLLGYIPDYISYIGSMAVAERIRKPIR